MKGSGRHSNSLKILGFEMGKKPSILHVASFIGNVGDNASHAGFYTILDELLGSYQVKQVEIRTFYLNYKGSDKKTFDKHFIAYANSFDLVIFGGGGFLDYWIPGSPTGTSIGIEPGLVKKLKTLTLITSMGSLPKKEIPEGNIDKYRSFLDNVFNSDNIKIAVRNDGSRQAIRNDIGNTYADRISEVVDSGFFYTTKEFHDKLIKHNYIAINVATDQVELLEKANVNFSDEHFYKELGRLINAIIHRLGKHVVLVPHLYGDLTAINRILVGLNDYDLRNYVTVGPCVQGDRGADFIFSLYKNSDGVIANRLHGNVCSLSMGKNVIGLPVLGRVKSIHESVDSKQFVSVYDQFSEAIIEKLKIAEMDSAVKNAIAKRKIETIDFYRTQLRDFYE